MKLLLGQTFKLLAIHVWHLSVLGPRNQMVTHPLVDDLAGGLVPATVAGGPSRPSSLFPSLTLCSQLSFHVFFPSFPCRGSKFELRRGQIGRYQRELL